MVKPFEDAVLVLAEGEVSPPVQTQFGWHVVRLNGIRNLEIPTLDEIRDALSAELQETGIEAEIQKLVDAADVTKAELTVDPSVVRNITLLDE